MSDNRVPTPERVEDQGGSVGRVKLPELDVDGGDYFDDRERLQDVVDQRERQLLAAFKENARLEEVRTREKNHLSQCLIMASAETNDWRRRTLKAEGTPEDELPKQFDHLPGWLHGGKTISDNRERCLKFTRERAETAEATLALRDTEIARLKEVLQEVFVMMTGAEGTNAPFDAERWSKCVLRVEAELARLRGE